MTYREIICYVKAYNARIETDRKKEEAEQENQLALVWLREHLHRQKRLPSLSEFLKKQEKPEKKKEQTPEQMLSVLMQLNASMGGTTY